MNQHVQILPDRVVDRIAAGEVVERPASVVKELVENALDAGSDKVHVSLLGGGLSEIRILDNGRGMEANDAQTALLRHATSKIRSDDDLQEIRSLGFRGEALPSIASVSQFFMETGMGLDSPGCRAELGAQGPVVEEAPPRKGTLVVVRNLFDNVPARRKFLKTERTELGRVQNVLFHAALSRPDVSFRLEHEGRKILDAPGGTDLRKRAGHVLGRALSKRLFPIEAEGPIKIRGLLGPPSDAISNTKRLHVVLNGRPIRDPSIIAAVRQSYGPLLAKGKTPPGILWMEMDPRLVDVNVHPAKTEVRFAAPGDIYRAVLYAVRAAVAETPWMNPELEQSRPTIQNQIPQETPQATKPVLRPWQRYSASEDQEKLALREPEPINPSPDAFIQRGPLEPPNEGHAPPSIIEQAESHSVEGSYSQLRYLGQAARLFLICDDGTQLVIIDQHAAHERVLYEDFRLRLGRAEAIVQPLLFPETMPATPAEVQLAEEHREQLLSYGLDIEAGGPESLVIRGVPHVLRRAEFAKLVRQILADLEVGSDSPSAEHKFGLVHATMACHAAVRAGDVLSAEEVKALLVSMDRVDLGSYCPHGRPVVARLDYDAIAHLFERH